MASKKEITRLLKAKPLGGGKKVFLRNILGLEYIPEYTTRKDRRNKKFSCFEMRSCKGRTKIRKCENKRYRANKMSLAPHKKEGANYQHMIW